MSIFRKLGLAGVVITLALVGIISCGSSSNNDQGTSFTALGYVTIDEEGEIQEDVGDAGRYVYVNTDASDLYSYSFTQGIAYMGLKNNLCKQFVRLIRFDCEYNIQGTDISFTVPSDSTNVGTIIAATGVCSGDSTSSSAATEDGEEEGIGLGNVAYVGFDMLSSDVVSYLMVNQNSLPALPFRMTSICRAVGVTQSGDTMVTNDLYYPIEFVEGTGCCTGTVGAGSTGTGGTSVGSGSTTTGSSSSAASSSSSSSAS